MSKLLINDNPIMVLPTLAVEIGLNEAIVLQQLHYWLVTYENVNKTSHMKNGKWWIYNTKEEWQENFPWWSESTVWRALTKLRDNGLIIATNEFNKQPYDRTLWYTINYEKLREIEDRVYSKRDKPFYQNDKMDNSNLESPIPETNPENTQRLNNSESVDSLRSRLKEAEEDTTSEDYIQGLRERNPDIARGIALKPNLDKVLDNLYDYEPHLQDVIKPFSRKWRIPPPPSSSKAYSKWKKDAREVYEQCKNADLSPEEVFKEAYYIWKTPPPFMGVPRDLYDGDFRVYDMGSVSKLVWTAISNILNGQRQRRVKIYTDPNGKEIEIEQ